MQTTPVLKLIKLMLDAELPAPVIVRNRQDSATGYSAVINSTGNKMEVWCTVTNRKATARLVTFSPKSHPLEVGTFDLEHPLTGLILKAVILNEKEALAQ